MVSFYEAPESTITISARQYTIEPGFPECRVKLDEYKGGGLGSNPPSVKYFDFVGNEFCPLIDLLDVFECVEGKYASYCSDSMEDIEEYLARYVATYAASTGCGSSKEVADVLLRFLQNLDVREQYFHREQYRENMVMWTGFFNDVYKLTASMANEMLGSGDSFVDRQFFGDVVRAFMDHCLRRLGVAYPKPEDMNIQYYHFLANFPKYRFTEEDCGVYGELILGANHYDNVGKGPLIVCNEDLRDTYLVPLIMFLSNWSLLLGVYLSMRTFGQCAFAVCWEGSLGGPLPGFRLTRG